MLFLFLVPCFVVVLFYTCNNFFVEVSKQNYDPKTVSCVKALFMDFFSRMHKKQLVISGSDGYIST